MALSEAQSAYAQAATYASDPDHAGLVLYQAADRDCDRCRTAIAEQRWDALTDAGHHAQRIVAALHDMTREDTDAGQAFRLSHQWAWQQLQRVIALHDLAALEAVQTFLADLADQLRRRLDP